MANQRQTLGRWGEALAADYLRARGYLILAHNVRTRYGEIDLIARQPSGIGRPSETIVFVEVKTRSNTDFGLPETGLTPAKQRHLRLAVQAYMQQQPDFQGDWRVDVIAIQQTSAGPGAEIAHFENALT